MRVPAIAALAVAKPPGRKEPPPLPPANVRGGGGEAAPPPVPTTPRPSAQENGKLASTEASDQPGIKVLSVKSVEVESRTMQGWLSKRGGQRGTKGWDRRWFHLVRPHPYPSPQQPHCVQNSF